MSKMKADFVCAFLANVPGIGEAQMELWRDPETGGLFAIESSFLDGKTGEMQSPYNPATTLKMPAEDVSQAVHPTRTGGCIVFPFLQDDKTFFAKIDWEKLMSQKLSLMALAQREFDEERQSHLLGVINMIEAMQDYAVDVLGFPESSVFPKEPVEGKDAK